MTSGTGTTLEELVRARTSSGENRYRVLLEIYRGVSEGKIRLVDPMPPTSFWEYLGRPDYSLWLYTVSAIIAITAALIFITDAAPYLAPARYIFGTIYILYIPGYILVEALYPEERSLKPLERVALSIGLSLAIIPLIGLLLNYTPWGIRLGSIVFSTLIYSLSLMIIAAYRKYSIVELSRNPRV